MSGGTLTTEAEFARLLYGDAVSTFGRPCSPRLIRKWWSEQHGGLVRPADLDVGELKNHLQFQGSYGTQEGMGGLVASHIGAVQTLRGGALMHLGHVTADIFEEESLSIRQLNVCSAVKGSEQGGDVGPDMALGVVFRVLELESVASVPLSDE